MMKAKTSDAPKISATFKENLKTKLSPEELAEYAKTLSEKYIENVQLEADKKGVVAEYKAKIDVILGQMGLLSQKVSTQQEWRDVDCHWGYNWDTDKKVLIRQDTGEVVREDKITQSDRQKLFPLEEKKEKRTSVEDSKTK
jgi:adenine-specific DNA methylase